MNREILDILESKIKHNALDFKTFIALLEADNIRYDPNYHLTFHSPSVDEYIQKQITHHKYPMTYKDLSLIQRLIARQSVSFSDPSATYKLVTEMAMSKALSDIKKD
jgi:D-alanyl-D-alanine carboxypeptidase